ncbi:MAG: tRNA (adenosine(37)-N6)-threonylcarbamoyltransferase complex ATPase subunit type 1 TsaE [Rhodovulum sp.]
MSPPAYLLETRLTLASEAETRDLAARLAPLLRAGDTLLLDGPIGAGKTAFARALIGDLQARAGFVPEDVPSPTFTLVQVYDAGQFEVWHADLYRLTHPHEVIELGLDEAFSNALCLVEWPDRLGSLVPAGALRLAFEPGKSDDARLLCLSAKDPVWKVRLEPLFSTYEDA